MVVVGLILQKVFIVVLIYDVDMITACTWTTFSIIASHTQQLDRANDYVVMETTFEE